MQVANRGLSGKARRVHHRKCAERLSSRQMIEEFLDPPTQDTPPRHIPIRGRRRFLPSIAHMRNSAAGEIGRQLELPLAVVESATTTVVSAGAGQTTSECKIEARADTTLRFPQVGKPTAGLGFKPPEQLETAHRFTVGGFLLGCAMGSAAAAVVLLVVQTTIR